MQNKKTEHNYIEILSDSLVKKINILDKIIEINLVQQDILKLEELDYDAFDKTIEDKDVCIREINNLDKGFMAVYERLKVILSENKQQYAKEIKDIQLKIKEITDKSVSIQVQEARNKEAFQEKVKFIKKEIKVSKTASKVAESYYQSMNKINMVDAQFLDTKK